MEAKRNIYAHILFIVLSLFVTGPGLSASYIQRSNHPIDLDSPNDVEIFIDGVIEAQRKAHQVAGAAVALVHGDKIILSKGYGHSNILAGHEVSGSQTMFRAASISKTFTATAIMQLVEQDKLKLDDDVNGYLQFRIPDTYHKPITIGNLLSHTAGFEDRHIGFFTYQEREAQKPLCQLLAENMPARMWEPGIKSAYSNYGYSLLGCVIEHISGLQFDDYMDRYILAPLGMAHSTFHQPVLESLQSYVTTGYALENGDITSRDFEYILLSPGGSLSTSAGDMARFMLAHLNGGILEGNRILSSDAIKLMHQPLFRNTVDMNGVGFAFYEQTYNGRRTIGHGGNLNESHSNMVLLPAENVGLFVVYNGPAGRTARDEFIKIFMDRFFPKAVEADVADDTKYHQPIEVFAGRYRSNRHNYTTPEKINGFSNEVSVQVIDRDHILLTENDKSSRWRRNGESMFIHILNGRPADDILHVEMDGAGKPVWLYRNNIPIYAAYRLSWFNHQSAYITMLAISGGASFLYILWVGYGLYKKQGTPAAEGCAAAATVLNLAFLAGLALCWERLGESPYRLPGYLLLSMPLLWIAAALVIASVFLQFMLRRRLRMNGRSLTIWAASALIFTVNFAYLYNLGFFNVRYWWTQVAG